MDFTPNKFQETYRISSSRLPHHDYSSNGYYFVTICTHDRNHYFGEIVTDTDTSGHNVEMQNFVSLRATQIGTIAHAYWMEIPIHFPFVELDEFVIMPNHIHGIIIIDKNDDIYTFDGKNTFGPQSNNLASIVRGFKTGVKKYATINNIDFAWQPRFHDRVIRDENALNNIRRYIQNNVINWAKDRNNVNNIWM